MINRLTRRAIIATLVSSGLIVPAQAKLFIPAAPAIIKPGKEWAAHEKILLANFLPGMMPSWDRTVAGGASPPTSAYIGTTTDTTSQDTYTFTNHAIGTADAERLVVVVVGEVSGAGRTISHDSMTIGGVAATRDLHNSGASLTSSIFSLIVAAGTTATIVVSTTGRAGSNTDMVIHVYTVTGNGSTPALTNTLQARATDPSGSITVADGGTVIAGSMQSGTAQTCAWTGVTEQVDLNLAIGEYSSGFDQGLASGARTITATWTGSATATLVAAAYA